MTVENYGRQLTFDKPPERVATGYHPVFEAVPEIADSIALPQQEALIAQAPDFVIDLSYSAFDANEGFVTIEELDAAGAAVYITAGGCDPQDRVMTIEEIRTDVRTLGTIFGVPERAAELVAQYQALLDDVAQRVEGREPVDVPAIRSESGPIGIFGGPGLLDRMIERAGGRNVLADVNEEYTNPGPGAIRAIPAIAEFLHPEGFPR